MRALAYYNLVSLFGDVPLKTIASSSEGISIARSPREEVLNQVVADLKDATSISETSAVGRVNSWTAKALLGKVYYKMAALDINAAANWQNAKEMFDAVYASKVYSLEPKFADLFGEYATSKEAIVMMNYSTGNASGVYNRASNRFAPQASTSGINWSTYRVAKFAYDMHEGTYPGDPRIEVNFLTRWRDRNGNNQANPKPQVGSIPTPNDSVYTYPYWKYTYDDGGIVPGTTDVKLVHVGKMPYAEFADPKNPSLSFIRNYETTHGESPYGSTLIQAVEDFVKVGNGHKWPYFGKLYDQKQTGTMAHKNLMVYRYAEMLLLMADVYNELGDTQKAISLANEVLARARKSGAVASAQPADWSSSLTKDEVTEKLYFERVIELCGEPAIYDMIRIRGTKYFKKLLELNANHELTIKGDSNYPGSNNNFADRLINDGNLTDDFLRKNLLLPIPTSEIDANPGLSNSDNNFGY